MQPGRAPRGGGEADFHVDGANGILGIHFSDVRNGRYRNVSYTIEYLADPTCRSCPEVAVLIDRVDPPGWPGGRPTWVTAPTIGGG